MDDEKTLQQAQENMKAINQAVESYQNGAMDADEAGTIICERLFGRTHGYDVRESRWRGKDPHGL